MEASVFIEALVALVAVVTLIIGLLEYTKAQRWKRMEFLSNEIKEFNKNSDVKRALLMLDWNIYKIPLLENEIKGKTLFYFNDELLRSALEFHSKKPSDDGLGRFTEEEATIRLIFDTFFEQLCTFQNHINNKLINHNDIKPYILYYIDILANRSNSRKDPETKRKLIEYINNYGYSQVKVLCQGLGYNIDDNM